ncbi:MAG: hypothetical protein K5988_03670 [Lachnospiraceae bacterium]|nr:hypothetical protein [Lachnospiraceae bacterium]
MIEKVIYKHDTARMLESIDIEIWVKDGKLYYNKRNFIIDLEGDNYADNAESSVSIDEFEKKLTALKIEDWPKTSLPPEDIVYLDGSDWKVKVKYEGQKEIVRKGENAYPANWNKFIKLLKLTVGKFNTITF